MWNHFFASLVEKFPHQIEPASIDRFSETLPHLAMTEGDDLVLLEGLTPGTWEGLGYVLELQPQTGVTSDMAPNLLGLFTRGLPVGSTIALTQYHSPYTEPIFDEFLSARRQGAPSLDPGVSDFLKTMTLSRIEHLKSQPASLKVSETRLWMSVVIPTDDPFDKGVLEAVRTAKKAHETLLKQHHFFLYAWGRDDLTKTLRECLNPQKVQAHQFVPIGGAQFDELRFGLVEPETKISVEENGLVFESEGAKPVVAIGLNAINYPAAMGLTEASLMTGSPFAHGGQINAPFALTSWMQIPNINTESQRTQAHLMRARQMLRTELASFVATYHDAERSWAEAQRAFESEGGIAKMNHQLVLFAPLNQKEQIIEEAQSIGRMAGIEWRRARAMHLQSFWTILPLAAGPLLFADALRARRLRTATVASIAFTLPLLGEWRGTPARAGNAQKTPLLLLVGRKGQLMPVDPFANQQGSYCGCVVGASGSGKSVLLNELALSNLATGGKTWIIDVGRSYEKLCRLLKGQFLSFSEAHHFNLNPFDRLLGENDEDFDMVVAILSELITTTSPLSDFERSCLSQHVLSVVKENEHPTIDDLTASLLTWRDCANHFDPRRHDLAMRFFPFSSEGPFARWFDRSGEPIVYNHAFTVLELEGLNAHPALRKAILMTLMLSINQAMEADREHTKLVIIDEAWDLLGNGHSGDFIESGYRRARKHKGAFFTATQSVADYWASETARAAWENADCRFYLRQKSESIEHLIETGKFSSNPWIKEAIASLTTEAGRYAEVLVKIGDAPASIGRLILDDFSRVTYSSHPLEVSGVNAWLKEGLTLEAAIKAVAAGRFFPTLEEAKE